jgi:hypothetical protein
VARSITDLLALQKDEVPATILPIAALHEALGFRALDCGSA